MLGYFKRVKPEQLTSVINSMTAMMQKQVEQMAAKGAQPEQTMQIQVEDN